MTDKEAMGVAQRVRKAGEFAAVCRGGSKTAATLYAVHVLIIAGRLNQLFPIMVAAIESLRADLNETTLNKEAGAALSHLLKGVEGVVGSPQRTKD